MRACSGGDEAAFDRLAVLIYAELRRIARGYMAHERPDQTLQATALVHEAYLQLVDVHNVGWKDRTHFFAVSAQVMRRILIDRARAAAAKKKGRRRGAHSPGRYTGIGSLAAP
ncbi:MAG: ECF-type sigma factor [Bryobacteraceae bacterium]